MRGDMKEKGEKLLLQCYGKHSHLLFRAQLLNGSKLPDTFEFEMRKKNEWERGRFSETQQQLEQVRRMKKRNIYI